MPCVYDAVTEEIIQVLFHRLLCGQESTCNTGDVGLILEWGRFSGEGNGNPLQCSCLGNPMDREAWQAIVHEVAKELDMT